MRLLIAHRLNRRALWSLLPIAVLSVFAIIPATVLASSATLTVNQQLNIGDQLLSSNGKARLVMQSDGDLVLYRTDTGAALWSTGTNGKPVAHALMQSDGNLVLYNTDNSVWYWNAGTYGNPGASLQLQDNANLVIRAQNGTVIWQTNTVQTWPIIIPYKK
ncbi:MAG: hypothetical protein J2P17_33100 [Mycobacterium sp.]|nr:hypothetical protein [Mycobacterium sp.]